MRPQRWFRPNRRRCWRRRHKRLFRTASGCGSNVQIVVCALKETLKGKVAIRTSRVSTFLYFTLLYLGNFWNAPLMWKENLSVNP